MKNTQIEYGGVMVPAVGRVTITQKKNGRFYVGMDPEAFGTFLALVVAHHRMMPPTEAADPATTRLIKAVNAFCLKHYPDYPLEGSR